MDDKRIHILRDLNIKKAVNLMALPAIIGFMVMAFYNMIDTLFVSWIGYQATGATQVVFPLTMIASSIGLAFGIGGGTYVSRLMGKNDFENAKHVVSTSYFSALFTGILFFIIVFIFMNPILIFFGASEEVLPYAISYSFYILIGSVFVIQSMVLNNIMRSEGSGKYSMIGLSAGSILNIILDPIFIFKLNMGINGAAMATMISQFFSLGVLLYFYFNGKTLIALSLKSFKFDSKIYSEIFKVGIPTFFRQLLFSFSMAFLNQQATALGGDALLASYAISIKVSSIPNFLVFGIGQGMQPVIGYNFGSKDKKRIIDSMLYGTLATLVITVICAIIIIPLAPFILDLFKPTSKVKHFGIITLRLFSVSTIILSVSNAISIYYQSLGKGIQSLFLSIARQGIFLIPLLYILPYFYGLNGLLFSQLIADILTIILTFLMFIPYIKNKGLDKDLNQ